MSSLLYAALLKSFSPHAVSSAGPSVWRQAIPRGGEFSLVFNRSASSTAYLRFTFLIRKPPPPPLPEELIAQSPGSPTPPSSLCFLSWWVFPQVLRPWRCLQRTSFTGRAWHGCPAAASTTVCLRSGGRCTCWGAVMLQGGLALAWRSTPQRYHTTVTWTLYLMFFCYKWNNITLVSITLLWNLLLLLI